MFRSFLDRVTQAAAPISALTTGIARMMVLVVAVQSAVLSAPADDELKPEAYRPQWKVGQRWVIAAVTLQSQARRDPKPEDAKQAVRWQFDVRRLEKIDDRNCFQVEVKCQGGEGEAITTLWVDEKTMTLRRVQTQLPVAGGLRTVTENYRSTSGQPFPAFAPLTVPPLELPLFLTGTKGSQTFEYEASSTPPEEKGVGDIEFAFSVDQQLTRPPADKVKGLVPEEYSKDLIQKPVLEVQLKAASSQVRQLWQPGLPWPVYSNNGIAESRLVEVSEPAKKPEEEKDKPQP
jgi:hypothetical protein